MKEIERLSLNGGELSSIINSIEFVEGKLDLRGLDLKTKTIRKLKVCDADFSFSMFNDCWVEKSLFERCYFEKVDFSSFSDHGNIFKECVFKNCKFNGAVVGYDGTKFLECEFIQCNFPKAIFIRPEFVGVFFKNSRIKGLDFNASSFEECDFEGQLNDIWFRGGFPLKSDDKEFGSPKKNEMKNVSFVNAELHDLTFSDHCKLLNVKINTSGKYYKFDRWSERLLLMKESISNWNVEEQREIEIFINVYSVHAQNQEWYILNIEDVEREYGKEIAYKIVSFLNSI
ncbi:pentapeptide repeat-containing protein [Myroides odoratimimus]|uniref:pentapeptide repeat-containing protein n=1 Tax=Myroides odoratimimus TaxID=76832 RepID=UPI0009168AF2|nr:pentapeptide repeat-containing protein [Myroides odoratimimus]SHM02948.1 Pentapeptide repeat-containing protein [Myroides odoratimimus subsp. xuanwuensis]